MNPNDLHAAPGSRPKKRRIGRGYGSGRGTTAGKGTKGQKARSGGGPRPYFEGGQLPLIQRLPQKGGFKNIFADKPAIVKLSDLEHLDASQPIDLAVLVAAGLVERRMKKVKVLGNGEVTRALNVTAYQFSASAKQKIEAAGGQAVSLAPDTSGDAANDRRGPKRRAAYLALTAPAAAPKAAPPNDAADEGKGASKAKAKKESQDKQPQAKESKNEPKNESKNPSKSKAGKGKGAASAEG